MRGVMTMWWPVRAGATTWFSQDVNSAAAAAAAASYVCFV